MKKILFLMIVTITTFVTMPVMANPSCFNPANEGAIPHADTRVIFPETGQIKWVRPWYIDSGYDGEGLKNYNTERRTGNRHRNWVNVTGDLHALLSVMGKFHGCYRDNPTAQNLKELIDQIDFVMSTTYPRTVGNIKVLYWKNYEGFAQGMEQMEYSAYMVAVAKTLASKNKYAEAKKVLLYATRLANSAFIPSGANTGGITDNSNSECGYSGNSKRPCKFYHSKGLTVKEPGKQTILNQHLHVVRDAIVALKFIQNIPSNIISPEQVSQHDIAEKYIDIATRGIWQLAYSSGWNSTYKRPPNLNQFVDATPINRTNPKYNYNEPMKLQYNYLFQLANGVGEQISDDNSQHYYMHTVKLLDKLVYGIMSSESETNYPSYRYILLRYNSTWRLRKAVREVLLPHYNQKLAERSSSNKLYFRDGDMDDSKQVDSVSGIEAEERRYY